MDHMNYISYVSNHLSLDENSICILTTSLGREKKWGSGRKLNLLVISFCCISTCEQSFEMARVKLPGKVARCSHKHCYFPNLSSTAIKQSHVISHWSWQDFNVFDQIIGFVDWLHLLQQVAPRLEMHWHLYHPTWPTKKTGREWFKNDFFSSERIVPPQSSP